MKSRLKAALDRADRAESSLEEAMAVARTDSMERGSPASGNSVMRRRGVGRSNSGTASISSVMHLNKSDKVGKVVDSLDSFSVSTGRSSSRGFVFYVSPIDLCSFC